jgi:hypothetical protein
MGIYLLVRSEKMRHKLKIFTKFQTSLFNFWGVLFAYTLKFVNPRWQLKKNKELKKIQPLNLSIDTLN